MPYPNEQQRQCMYFKQLRQHVKGWLTTCVVRGAWGLTLRCWTAAGLLPTSLNTADNSVKLQACCGTHMNMLP